MVYYLHKLRVPAGWQGKLPENPDLKTLGKHEENLIVFLGMRLDDLIFGQFSRYPHRAEEEFKTYCASCGLTEFPAVRSEVTAEGMISELQISRYLDYGGVTGVNGPLAFFKTLRGVIQYEWIVDMNQYGTHEKRLTKARQSRCAGLEEELERLRGDQGKGRRAYAIQAATERTGRRRAEVLAAAWYDMGLTQFGRVSVVRPDGGIRYMELLYRNLRGGVVMVLLDKTERLQEHYLQILGAMAERFESVLTIYVAPPQNIDALKRIEGILSRTQMCWLGWEKDAQKQELKQSFLSDARPGAVICQHAVPHPKRLPVLKTSPAMRELDSMIGLTEVKQLLHQIVDHVRAQQIYEAYGFKPRKTGLHMVFYGNPGVAKTTVARLVARIFKDYGVLKGGKLMEVGRSDLVGQYSGWSAKQTADLVRKAAKEGNILFLDEAYSLVAEEGEDHFGREALDTLVQEMENHRNDMVVILAGYKEPMKRLLAQNQGLSSRISWHIEFKDYTEDELWQIVEKQLRENERCIRPDDESAVRALIQDGMQSGDFGNGRWVRNLVDKALMRQSSRIVRMKPEAITVDAIRCLTAEDLCGSVPVPATAPNVTPGEDKTRRLIGFLR